MDGSVSAEMPCSQPVLRNAPLDAHPLRDRLEPAGREGHAVFLRHGHPSRPQDLMPPEIPKDCLAPASLLWQTLALLHNCIVAILKKSISNIEYTLDAYPARQQQKPWYAAWRLHLRSGQRSDILPGQPGVSPLIAAQMRKRHAQHGHSMARRQGPSAPDASRAWKASYGGMAPDGWKSA